MRNKILLFVLLISGSFSFSFSQDLDQLLDSLSTKNTRNFVFGTFKGNTIINGQSVELPGTGDLNFRIAHRFGALNLGMYELFGLDQATMRLGFEYGLSDYIGLSVGRSSFEKTYDAGAKVRLLKQQTGYKNIPFSLTVYSAIYAETLKWTDPERENLFSSRLSYATQLLIARKFGQKLSLQLSPSYVHKNLVPTPEDDNNIFAAGFGGRYKITRKFSVNAEYFYLLSKQTAKDYINSLSVGVDIETGGHVFQLQLTNSQAMIAKGFIAENTGEWLNGDIYFGFNLVRVFPINERGRNIF